MQEKHGEEKAESMIPLWDDKENINEKNTHQKVIVKRFGCGGCLMVAVGVFSIMLGLGLFMGFMFNRVLSGQGFGFSAAKRNTPIVLEIDLQNLVQEQEDSIQKFFSDGRKFADVVFTLRYGLTDERVKGVMVWGGSPAIGLAEAAELADLLHAYKQAGKVVAGFTDTMGEVQSSLLPYLILSVAEPLWIQPSGDLMMVGPAMQVPFLKDALKKIGVEPQFYQRKEYKNAVNTFTESQFTEPHQVSMQKIVQDISTEISKKLALYRTSLGTEEQIRTLIQQGALSSERAKELKMVDALGYRKEALTALQVKLRESGHLETQRQWWWSYAEDVENEKQNMTTPQKKVAWIEAKGVIKRGKTSHSPWSQSEDVGGQSLAHSIRKALLDDEIEGILLEVDSPGGSYIASDTVWSEMQAAKDLRKKPIVVLMRNLAASGGYFISMAADVIVASPFTLTGSIGVYSGKFVIQELLQKLQIHVGTIAQGDISMLSMLEKNSPAAEQQMNAMMDRIYLDFVTKAAQGRKMEVSMLEPLARGRVWTGAAAHQQKLVDELGGYWEAVTAMKKQLGVPVTDKIALMPYPLSPTPIEKILGFAAQEKEDEIDNSDQEDSIRLTFHQNTEMQKVLSTLPMAPWLYRISLMQQETLLLSEWWLLNGSGNIQMGF
jgi:protease-4